MTIRTLTYRLAIALALFGAKTTLRAETCHKNMLVIQDGSSYVSVDAPKQMPTGALTLECWAQAAGNIANGAGLIEYGDAPDTGAFSLRITANNQVVVTLRLNTGIVTLQGVTISNTAQWHHYAATFIPGDSVCLYVDGMLVAGMPTSATSVVGSYNTLYVGRSPSGGASFVGDIDELRIWNVARTIGQIAASRAQPLVGNESGLVTYFKFDDDPSDPHIHDFSSHGNNATYTGAVSLALSTAPIQGPPPNGYMLASKDVSVIFPPLICSTSAIDTVRVFNRGDESIQIDHNGFLSGKVFSVSSTSGFPLAAGDTTHYGLLIIQANATKPGDYDDTLVVVSSTVCGGEVRVPVHVRKDVVGIAFQDSVFFLNKPYKLLNCNLPIERLTHLDNTGSKNVTITALAFDAPGPITIVSPVVPFTIDSGKSQDIKFRVDPGPPTVINATLRATTKECSVGASTTFQGERISQSFSVAPSVVFPTVHDPAVSYYLYDTLRLKNTGTSDLYFSPGMQLLGASVFRLVAPNGGLAVVRPDSTLAIVVQFNVVECGTYQASLTMHLLDNRDCPLDSSITISATILGPDIAAIADTIDLGAGCVSRDTTLIFHNQSGRDVTVGIPRFSPDSVIFLESSGVLPRILADGDSVALQFRFAPREPGEYTTDVRFPLAPCGDKLVTFTGIYGVGKFVLSDSVVDFGTACDLAPQTQTIQLKNLAARSVTVNDTSIRLSNEFSLVDPPLPFTFAPGEVKTLTVRFAPSTRGAKRGEIWLFENGCYVKKLVGKAVREHANVAVDSSFVEFGAICPGDSGWAFVTLTNQGVGDVSIESARVIGDTNFHVANVPTQPFSRGETRNIALTLVPTDTAEYGGLLEVFFGPCGDTAFYTLHGAGGPKPQLIASDTVLDFGRMKVGYPDTMCLTLKNPSCLSIPVVNGMFPPLAAPYSYTSISLATAIDSSHPVEVCIAFDPKSSGQFKSSDTIRSGSYMVVISLKGRALAPNLVHPSVVDFGSVLVGTPKSENMVIKNLGDTSTSVSFDVHDPQFDLQPRSALIDTGSAPATEVASFTPKGLGLQADTVIMNYDNHSEPIIFRGRGVGPGPLFSVSEVEFDPVRVFSVATKEVDVTSDKPTNILSVTMQGGTNTFTVSPTGTRFITGPTDTVRYTITYRPVAEVHDSTTLVLSTTTSNDVTLSISGDGVDAHLAVSDSVIDFGKVPLRGTPSTRLLKISNSGGYPLTVFSAKHVLPVFGATTDSVQIGPIAPHTDTNIVVSFKPRTDIDYEDTLSIAADAPEHETRTALRGSGVFAPFGYPQITFTLPHEGARVGDIVDVPIELGGSDLDLVAIDTFTIDINYDPTVVYFHDTVLASYLTAGWDLALTRRAPDTIRLSGRGPTLPDTPGVLCTLRAEALLGPHDSSGLIVGRSDPRNSADLQSSAGSFVVTDCGNYRGGIVFKGNYSLAPSTPNPATKIVTIPYELGLAAHAKIDLYDQLGRHVRTLLDADRGVGAHTLTVDLGDLPNGEYYYVLESLEYRSSEKLILVGH